jgi:hypothetical protein
MDFLIQALAFAKEAGARSPSDLYGDTNRFPP